MLPLPHDLLLALQARAARGALGAFLAEVDLSGFRTEPARHWGHA